MYINYAYIREADEDICDNSMPLIITAAGYNKLTSRNVVATERPRGRSDYQLIYIASGKAHFFFEKEEKVVSHGNIVIYRPGESQMYYYYLNEATETYWVHFTGFDADKLLSEADLTDKVFYIGESSDHTNLFSRIIREIQMKRTNFQEISIVLFKQFLLMSGRYLNEGKFANRDTLNEVERAISYFNDNYSTEVNIEEYAKKRHMSVSWFIRNFRNTTKQTPLQYLIDIRITNAKALLTTTDDSVSQIANAVGFDNPLYFSRLFHKHTGMSPMKYRKRN